ncbi:MAG: N-acetylmuramic acid 6-phosphate etherase, partial [Fuerstiella sp.]|nr:N-acetylmuramic acid 6-phosphate etherase [Fuerstiella sp.]
MTSKPRSVLISNLTTETVNPASAKIDTLSPAEIVRLMNAEDATIPQAIARETESIANAITVITERVS